MSTASHRMSLKVLLTQIFAQLGDTFNLVNAIAFAALCAVKFASIFSTLIYLTTPYIQWATLIVVLCYNSKKFYDLFKKKRKRNEAD
jgi:hypothetical protein